MTTYANRDTETHPADELEALWRAEPAEEPAEPTREEPTPRDWPRAAALVRRLRHWYVWAWIGVFLFLFAFAPAPSADVHGPAWSDWALAGSLVGAIVSILVVGRLERLGYALGVVAASLGVALGYACRATMHHTGDWWLVETVFFAGLGAMALTGAALAHLLRAANR